MSELTLAMGYFTGEKSGHMLAEDMVDAGIADDVRGVYTFPKLRKNPDNFFSDAEGSRLAVVSGSGLILWRLLSESSPEALMVFNGTEPASPAQMVGRGLARQVDLFRRSGDPAWREMFFDSMREAALHGPTYFGRIPNFEDHSTATAASHIRERLEIPVVRTVAHPGDGMVPDSPLNVAGVETVVHPGPHDAIQHPRLRQPILTDVNVALARQFAAMPQS